MNLFHTLRPKAEFANIVFVCAGCRPRLTTQRNLTILQIEKALARKRLAPYLVIKKNDRSSWGTVRRSFFLAFFIVMVLMCDRPCDLKCNKNCSAKKRQ